MQKRSFASLVAPTLMAGTLFAVAFLAVVASVAFAAVTYPPGPAYRSCPDSVTPFQLQQTDTLLNPCYPALNDTVRGLSGVIVGFRRQSTGRIYLENSQAADYGGVQIYTRNIHYENLGYAIGDSIRVIRGIMGYYQGENEVTGNNSSDTSTTFIRIQKIAAGTLPPYRVGTTTTYRWTPVPTSHPGLPSVGSLVQVNDLKVARRVGIGSGASNEQYWLCVNADGSAPGDSVLIDGCFMMPVEEALTAPPLGTRIDRVRGIMRRATVPSGQNALMISLLALIDPIWDPPNLVVAYPSAENKLILQFDRNLDEASAENTANYQLGSALGGSTVGAAVLLGGAGTKVELTITEVLPRLSLESVQSKNIGSAPCPACLSPHQTEEFILGVLTVAEVQAPLEDSLGAEPCLDKSRFAGPGQAFGPRFTVRGVVSAKQSGSITFLEDGAGGQRSGGAIYQVNFPHEVGRQYVMALFAQEYCGMTELRYPVLVADEGPVTPPAPVLATVAQLIDRSCDPNQEVTNGEDFEGVLVRIEDVKVVGFNEPWPPPYSAGGSFRVAGPYPACTDTIRIDGGDGAHFPGFTPEIGQVLNINGSFHLADDRDPQLWPRSASDITLLGWAGVEPGTVPSKVTFSIGPSPARVTNVRFALPKQADVDLSVFDLSGRKVATLVKGSLAARSYEYEWNGAGVGAGVYFVRLRVGSEMYNLRTVCLK